VQKVCVIIPTLNAEKYIGALLEMLIPQKVDILIIDSSSSDQTVAIAKEYGVNYHIIEPQTFDHGGTRTLGAKVCEGAEFLIYLTQDARPYDQQSIANLLLPFKDTQVGAVYGRQLPYEDESPFGTHLRLFNYRETSYRRSYEDKRQYGIKTVFLSDSFAAYRVEALRAIGYFKDGLILGEDMHAGARLLKQGYHIAYQADAKVYHSHGYTIAQEFKRYFDIGVFHQCEDWILKEFGKPEGEGKKFVISEMKFLIGQDRWYLLPSMCLRTLAKLIGYKLGKNYQKLPKIVIKHATMNASWWKI